MTYAIFGYLIVFTLLFCLMRGKAAPIPLFCFVPIIGALLAGYSPIEVNGFVVKGIQTVVGTAVLLSFSVIYFLIMNEVGIFDPLVEYLAKHAGNNVVAVTITSAIVAIIAHIEGATAATVLVTVPAMLPLYRRLHIRPEALLAIVAIGMGVMNLLPWGGPTARLSAILGIGVTELWRHLIPTQIFGCIVVIICAATIGLLEKRRGAGQVSACEGEAAPKVHHREITPKLIFNLLLTIVLIGLLSSGKFQAYVLFMFATGIALFVNFKTLKEQEDAIKRGATPAFLIAATMMAAGVFVGVLNQTPMMREMANLLISAVPTFLLKYLHIILGLFAAPIGMATGTDAFFFGIVPLFVAAGSGIGISAESVGYAALLGKNTGVLISPLTPATFIAIGLAGVELKDHIKYTFPWVMLISALSIGFGVLTGLIKV